MSLILDYGGGATPPTNEILFASSNEQQQQQQQRSEVYSTDLQLEYGDDRFSGGFPVSPNTSVPFQMASGASGFNSSGTSSPFPITTEDNSNVNFSSLTQSFNPHQMMPLGASYDVAMSSYDVAMSSSSQRSPDCHMSGSSPDDNGWEVDVTSTSPGSRRIAGKATRRRKRSPPASTKFDINDNSLHSVYTFIRSFLR